MGTIINAPMQSFCMNMFDLETYFVNFNCRVRGSACLSLAAQYQDSWSKFHRCARLQHAFKT